MAITWGATTLNIIEYSRTGGELYYSEQELIADPTLASTVAQSVLQGFGRNRIKVFIEGFATDAEAATFNTDKNAATSRTLTIDFDNSFADTMMIYLFETRQQKGIDRTFYTMELIEV
jgi:hypothetical protein